MIPSLPTENQVKLRFQSEFFLRFILSFLFFGSLTMCFFRTVESQTDTEPEPDIGSQSRPLIRNKKGNQNFYFSYLCYIYKFGYSLLKNSCGYPALPGIISQLNQL
jgi:hypothetical protein